ncbi:helix-hairpin-helix domain-containing protein [Flavihumibacter solisilvae]|uniref:Helix-hairpin-helix DNA-binding motif class 1 domain-containing protein n=1 Tax=Flavihumibacter solisilvae TaxID=1349421 RepID=A0A0C1IS07_9BACT|nr:helix-hairpin-helix domain-containing protein [Flavihumibacter solisilvae]KIC93219.1 hypothetical protein OI18_18365 [Flavihumibacter solisilvae]
MKSTQMKALVILFIMIYSGSARHCSAQELPGQESGSLEMLAAQNENELENDEQLLQLSFLKGRQLNINAVSLEQLSVFSFLTPLQLQSFFQYRHLFGPFISRYELQAVPGWDIITIRRILPFLSVSNDIESAVSWKEIIAEGQSQLLLRTGSVVEKSKGYIPDSVSHKKYSGDPSKFFFRYTYQYRQRLWWGLSGEKDAGEVMGVKKGIDFTGFHVMLRGNGFLRVLAIGDYVVNIGQGLTQWQGLAFGKSGESIQVFRQGNLLAPYRSAGEWNFHRGLAGSFQYGNFELTTFISHRKLSGNLVNDTSVAAISSLSETGYHRTAGELEDRNRVRMICMGANLEYRRGKLQSGINIIQYRFSHQFIPANEPYNYYAFRGKSLLNPGAHYNYHIRNAFFFGEVAKGFKGAAVLQGMIINLHRSIDMSLVYRKIDPGYKAFFASALTEGSNVNNETGFYLGMKFMLSKGWVVSAYADHFHFPWLRFRNDAPSSGQEYLIQVNWTKKRKWETYIRMRYSANPENGQGNVVNETVSKRIFNARVHAELTLNRQLVVASRFDYAVYNKDNHRQFGFAAYADAKYQLAKPSITLSVRSQFFNTDGYESRIYAYERDVLYTYSIPSFFDSGWRYYLQIQGKLPPLRMLKSLTFSWWVRWAQTLYNNKSSIGSGQDEISGNQKSDWKCQLIVNLQKHE